MPSANATPAMPGTAAIRLGVAVLGAVGFALSYDALRQMAVAIHIRGLLTYTFPLVIDGFIAIGVGALLILRTAPLGSRLYVWVLVGIATTTSIWANALHAIRLNQQTRNTGLHLDDITVGVLSAIAPLALAGSVHLYLVIRRHPLASHTDTDAPKQPSLAGHFPSEGAADAGSDVAERSATVADRQGAGAKPRGRQPSATMDELLAIGRNAPRGRDGRISRRAVESEIRAKGHSVGKDRVADATRMLQAELNEAR